MLPEHWIFFVNLPIGVVVALFAIRLVPDRPGLGFARASGFYGVGSLRMTSSLPCWGVSPPPGLSV